MDEVDRILQAWARETPDLDVSPLRVLSRVSRLARHLDFERRDAFAIHSLDTWEFDVLAALRRAGRPYRLSPGQLLRETHVTSGTMTNRVDRLVARGAVTRDPDPDDGRGMLVTLTPAGLELVDAALVSLVLLEEALLAEWDPQDRAEMTDYLRRLLIGSV